MQSTTASIAVAGSRDDADYNAFLDRVNARFQANTNNGALPVFTTNAEGLWDAYLNSFEDPQERQHHNCNACRRFIERFGSLVTIDADGRTAPAIWNEDDASEAYRPAVAALARIVRRAKVTGVFLSSEREWGARETGDWHHLAVTPPASMIFKRATQTAGQAMAEKREDFKTVMRALDEFSLPTVEQALTLLRADVLYRSEKVIGPARWLHDVHLARNTAHGSLGANVVWLAVALAPTGFCHPRSSMVGTLLEDIAADMSFDEVSRRFAAKMHPLQYQRPQVAPSAGTIAQAEKIVEQMGIARSLARRYARIEDVLPNALWQPTPKQDAQQAGGVFGHLKSKTVEPGGGMIVPPQVMTWDKFQRTVLPTAERIEFRAPASGAYTSLLTASDPDAPPILQWDREDQRNPLSWYFWHQGSRASQFGLVANLLYPVKAITLKPSMLNGEQTHHGRGVLFIIDGAADSRTPGLCLFPEFLKAELHGVRKVIEAHSSAANPEGADQQTAAGVMLQENVQWNAHVRVWSGGRHVDYKLDRWD